MKKEKRPVVSLDGKAITHSLLALVHCSTGYCGSDSNELVMLDVGEDVDELTRVMAMENAQSYGDSGHYECPSCGAENDGEGCDSCDTDMRGDWVEEDSAEGYATLFRFPDMGLISESCEDVMKLLVELKALELTDTGVISAIHSDTLKSVMDFDADEFEEFCSTYRQRLERQAKETIRKQPAMFGLHKEHSLASLAAAVEVSAQTECGMDDVLGGGDLAASEYVIRDLLTYIKYLHTRFHVREEGHNDYQ